MEGGDGKANTNTPSKPCLGPKPALLPKPQSLKTCIKGKLYVPDPSDPPKQHTPSTTTDSALQNVGQGRKKPLSLFVSKAPVAKLDEFDSLYETTDVTTSPTRPPRSPKIKVFPEGPFNKVDERPELPVKKRLGHSLPSAGKDDRQLDSVKKRSSSLGRLGNDSSLSANIKCKSLGRNVLLSKEAPVIDGQMPIKNNKKTCPVPPPRRRKKSEEVIIFPEFTAVGVPIYAHVNYEMKKTRRCISGLQKSNVDFEEKLQGEEEQEKESAVPVIEGRLLLMKGTLEGNSSVRLTEACLSRDTLPYCKDDSSNLRNPEPVRSTSSEGGDRNNVILDDGNYVEDSIAKKCTNDDPSVATNVDDLEGRNIPHAINDSDTHILQETVRPTVEDCGRLNSKVCVTKAIPRKSQLHDFICKNTGTDREELGNLNNNTDKCSKTEECIVTICHGKGSHSQDDVQANANNAARLYDDGSESSTTDTCSRDISAGSKSTLPVRSIVVGNVSHLHGKASNEIVSDETAQKKIQMVHSFDNETVSTSYEDTFSELARMTAISDNAVNHEMCDTKEECINCEAEVPQPVDVRSMQYQDVNMNEKIMCINHSNRPISTSEVSKTSDLVIVEGVMETKSENEIYLESRTISINELDSTPPVSRSDFKLWRRQSWSSSKDTTPSPRSARKPIHSNGPAPWCDEGDLSNGALADSDSSDNTGRKSRNKITGWLMDSFGKGGLKRRERVRSNSQFYGAGKQTAVKTIDIEQPTLNISLPDSVDQIDSIGRPSSGISEVLDNVEASASIDERFRDSESDNEERATQRATSRLSEVQQKDRKVFFIAQELMTSERQFVGVLRLLNVDFVEAVNKPGLEHNPAIPSNELAKILNGLPQLQMLNEELLRDLEIRIKNWSSNPKIADVIVKKGAFLKLYSSYIKNFETQCNYLDELCIKFPRFGQVVKRFEALPICKNLEIKHFMLKPVQRIPQYRLLLENYQRHLEPSSLEYKDTAEAIKIVRDVAEHANRTIKLGDHLTKLIQLQSQLDNYEIIKPGRTYLKDGELFKLSRKVRHPRYFILLNDCLLYTSRLTPSLLRVNNELPLHGMKVFIPQVDDNLNEFNIISVTRSFTLSASSDVERRDWITALESAIKDHVNRAATFTAPSQPSQTSMSHDGNESNLLRLGRQAPVWIQDVKVTMCQSCAASFTVLFRRHHCRACGKVVCRTCSENRAPLSYMDYQAARVCGDCYETLLHDFQGPEHEHIIQDVVNGRGFKNRYEAFETVKALFKKSGTGNNFIHLIPQRLTEVAANDTGSQMSGWLQRRGRRSWKRLWFVLKDQVLYVYKASEDVVALESIPILGYRVEPMAERHFEIYEGIDAKLVFQLAHVGQLPLVFHADTEHLAKRWMTTMEEATILH